MLIDKQQRAMGTDLTYYPAKVDKIDERAAPSTALIVNHCNPFDMNRSSWSIDRALRLLLHL